MNGATVTADPLIGNPGPAWHALGAGDYLGNGRSDILLRNNNSGIAIWETSAVAAVATPYVGNPGPAWHPIFGS